MITILVIAPYQKFADEFADVIDAASRAAAPGDAIASNIIVEYDHAVLAKLRPECDVVIARGYSAALLRQSGVPVVEVQLLPYDILHALHRCRAEYPDRKVVFPATPAFSQHARYLAEFMDLGIEIIDMPSTKGDEPERAFAKIQAQEFAIIGGQPVCTLAEKRGIPHMLIESGPEAMQAAFAEARRLAVVRRQEMEKHESFKAILDYNTDRIIALDKENRFTSINAMAGKILGISTTDALGKRLEDFYPEEYLPDFLARTPHCSDEVAQFDGVPLVINKTGIFLEGERIGSVVTLQYVAKIQKSEKSIRNKITERGLVARHRFDDILGVSQAIKKAVQTARKYSQVDAGVLIMGKSGTGKELFAQSIHNESQKQRNPFMAINCAALPESLLESELFGYVDGAFTGAVKGGKSGLIELAHNGTLFLDEIGEMPLRLQGRLLRVLQEKEIMRLGSEKITPVSIRVIAATNKDLSALVRDGAFRDDLYYRLAVLTLTLPPLEERRDDIPVLTAALLDSFAKQLRRPAMTISDQAMDLLVQRSWPGNVRELRNACERLAVLCESGCIGENEVLAALADFIAGESIQLQPRSARQKISKERVEALLSQGITRQGIADKLGINRITLWRKMREWNMLQ